MTDEIHISDLPEQIERIILAKLSPLERNRFVVTSKQYAKKFSFFLHACPITPVYNIPSQEDWEIFLNDILEHAKSMKPHATTISITLGVRCIIFRYIENSWIPYMYWFNEPIEDTLKLWFGYNLIHYPISETIYHQWKNYITRFMEPVQEMYHDLCDIMNENSLSQNYDMEFHIHGMNGEINAHHYAIEYTGMIFNTPFICEFRTQEDISEPISIFSIAEDVETIHISSLLTDSQKVKILLWIHKYSSLREWSHASTSIPVDPMSIQFPEICCQPRWTYNGTILRFHI